MDKSPKSTETSAESNIASNRETAQEVLSGEKLRQRLVLLLKEKGPDDPEAQALLQAWIVEQEQAADMTPDNEAARIELNVKRARLYLEAGRLEEARENFADAAEYARQMGMDELCQQITGEMAVF